MRVRYRIGAAMLATMAGLALMAGCSRGGGAVRNQSAGPDLSQVRIPAPAETAVLTVGGRITKPNKGSSVEFDVATLETLPIKSLTVQEPFLKKPAMFTGVDMRDLLASVGVEEGAQTIHFTAVDDYQVDLDVQMLQHGGVLLASTHDGARIAVDKGGPIRIVFPDGHSVGKNSDLWIWSVVSMEIR